MAQMIRYKGQLYKRVDKDNALEMAKKVTEQLVVPFIKGGAMSVQERVRPMGDKYYCSLMVEPSDNPHKAQAKLFALWKKEIQTAFHLSGLKIHSVDSSVNGEYVVLKALVEKA